MRRPLRKDPSPRTGLRRAGRALVLGLLGPLTLGAGLAGPVAGPASAGVGHWHIRDLGVLPGGISSTATAVNDRGDVVGHSDTGAPISPTHAVLWRHGRIIDLGTLGGTDSSAAGINDAGDVVGTSQTRTGAYHAFLWRHGRMIDLGTLGGSASSATAINNRGEVVGHSETKAGTTHAFLWRRGRMIDLGTLRGGFSRAYAVNDRGQAVGDSSVDGMNSVPVMFWHGTVVRLDSRYGQGSAINDVARVTGYRFGGNGSFTWYRGRVVDLLAPRGGTFTQAAGINRQGQIVGYGDGDAVLWNAGYGRPAVHPVTLPRLRGGATAGALALNDHGLVVGYASTDPSGGNPHAVAWWR